MNSQIIVNCLSTGKDQKESVEFSSFCPCCGVHLSPQILYGILIDYEEETENKIFLLNFCPECDECFISKHTYNEDEYAYSFHSAAPMTPSKYVYYQPFYNKLIFAFPRKIKRSQRKRI